MPQKQHIMHGRDHYPWGADPIPAAGISWEDVGPATLEEIILADPCLVAFRKLNDSSGDIAVDSGPNGYDVGGESGDDPPTWGQPAGPPGEPSAGFVAANGLSNPSPPSLTGDLTLEIWANLTATTGGQMIGQGNPGAGSSSGVELHRYGATTAYWAGVVLGDSPSAHAVVSDDSLPVDTWHHIVATRDTHVWTLYVDGVAQTDSFDDTGSDYAPAAGGIWVGTPTAGALTGNLSYGAVYNCALTPEQILAHYEQGTT